MKLSPLGEGHAYSCWIIHRAWSMVLHVENIGQCLLIDLLDFFFTEYIPKKEPNPELGSHLAKNTACLS